MKKQIILIIKISQNFINYSNFKTKDYENYKLNVKTIDQCNPKDENPIKEKYEMEWVPTKFYFQEDDKIDKTFDCLITTIK